MSQNKKLQEIFSSSTPKATDAPITSGVLNRVFKRENFTREGFQKGFDATTDFAANMAYKGIDAFEDLTERNQQEQAEAMAKRETVFGKTVAQTGTQIKQAGRLPLFLAREVGAGMLSLGRSVTPDFIDGGAESEKNFDEAIFGREVNSVQDAYVNPAVEYAEGQGSGAIEKTGVGILAAMGGFLMESPVGGPAKTPFRTLLKNARNADEVRSVLRQSPNPALAEDQALVDALVRSSDEAEIEALVTQRASELQSTPAPVQTAQSSEVDTNVVSRDQALPQTVRAGDEVVNTPKIESTPASQLSVDAKNSLANDTTGIRDKSKVFADETVAREGNITQPIEIRTLEDGSTVIVDGRHRLQAAVDAGVERVPTVDVTADYIDDLAATAARNVDEATDAARRVDEPNLVDDIADEVVEKLDAREVPVRQMRRSQETASFLRIAEQEGLFPSQQAGITTRGLERKAVAIDVLEDTVLNNPARQLARYANRNGQLPEVTGEGGIFARTGDDIVTELGFPDTETARDAYEKYAVDRQTLLSEQQAFRRDVNLLKDQNKNLPKEFQTLSDRQVAEVLEKFNDSKQGGLTENIIEALRKKGLSPSEIDEIVLENGEKLVDTVRVKKEVNGMMSAVITKRDIEGIEKAFEGRKTTGRWVKRRDPREAARAGKDLALEYYELPQVFFDRNGLRQWFYDPVRQAERNAQKMKTEIFQKFDDAGLMKRGGWFTADRFKLSKSESSQVSAYYLERQGRGGGVMLDDLSDNAKKFVETFDSVIKETEERFFEVARLNGKEPGKVKNYAPIMTSDDIRMTTEMGDMDFIFRKHPAFFSLKKRVDDVPFELYEKDYRKVAARWIDQMANFNHLAEVTPQVKYLANSDEFAEIVGEKVFTQTNKWIKDTLNPQVLSEAEKAGRFLRKAAAISSLGLNILSVVKQALSQIPVTIIEKAPPKLKSKFARDFDINVADLPSIKERKGMVAIADMQEGINRAFVGMLSEFDKSNAQLSLNGLLDAEYRKVLKESVDREISEDMQAAILKNAQDKLDMWYGGMTPAQMPRAFRSELGKLINMFISPLTSQLNGFIYTVAKAQGPTKARRIAEVATAAITIAYVEQVITNLSTEWSDEEQMTDDVLKSLAGNIPLVSQVMFAYDTDQPLSPSPILGSISRLISQFSKYGEERADAGDVALAFAELFGLPKQIRRSIEGAEVIEDEGFRDRSGKLLAPVNSTEEKIRAMIRGKYGTVAVQDYLRNVGVSKDDRRWSVPEVEFLQNGDYDRKAEIYRTFDEETQEFLRGEMSENQLKKLDKALRTKPQNSASTLDSIFSREGTVDQQLESIFSE